MWARKRIDISTVELLAASLACFRCQSSSQSKTQIEASFASPDSDDLSFVCTLSVRSGFDLLLKSLSWAPGSEILFSGLTIGDMPKIATAHGLIPVGTRVEPESLSSTLSELSSKITPQTKAIVIAHLMGGRCNLSGIAELCRWHGLMLIEDCAQCFVGKAYVGSPLADVSMFSFGVIKTNTCLGGGVLTVRNQNLAAEMVTNQRQWPVQSRLAYLKRIAKYSFVKLLSTYPIASLIKSGCMIRGSDHDQLASGLAKSFPGDRLLAKIRRQPSDALLSLMATRLQRFDDQTICRRTTRSNLLTQAIRKLNPDLVPVGHELICNSHWVYAIQVSNARELTETLWQHGFDATSRSSLVAVAANEEETANTQLLEQIVFLPIDQPIPDREIVRLGKIVARIAQPVIQQKNQQPEKLRIGSGL